MKFFRNHKYIAISITLAILGLSNFSNNVFADDLATKGIQISPTIQRVELDPGAHYEGYVTITNIGSHYFNFTMSAEPYQVSGDDYGAVFNIHNGYTQITNWISFEESSGSVAPGEVKNVAYIIDVPTDAPGGGQFAAIFAETDRSASSETVQANASVGTVVIAHINGETREDGGILETKIPNFLLNPPLTASVRLENTGNIDEEVKNTLEIKNYFSNEVIYEDTTPQANTLLPGTNRTITLIVNNIPRLGVMKVSLTTEYLNDAQIKTATVIVCPLWFIAIIVLIIATILFRILAKKRDDRRTRANSRNSTGSADKFNI